MARAVKDDAIAEQHKGQSAALVVRWEAEEKWGSGE
jgi:hypothetical protein